MGKTYYFDPCDITVQAGDPVIVETSRGEEYGEAILGNTDLEDSAIVHPLKKLIRIATEQDTLCMQENEQHAQDAFLVCKDKIEEHHLDMHLVSVECTFDRNKILFYFTSDGRVDFRGLVKDLASIFRTRIELRQIGVRDEAKMLGGLGACGRELCCSSYLDDFQPVSINMAKEQNLSLNPTKISGTCGRLMCCLKYEHEVYAELQRTTPKQGSYVTTPDGNGYILSVQMLRGLCRVQLEDQTESIKVYPCSDLQVLRAGKGRGRYAPATADDAGTTESTPRRPRPNNQTGTTGARTPAARPASPNTSAPAPVAQETLETDDAQAEGAARRRSRRGGRRRKKPAEGDADQAARTPDSVT